jgi:PAS domain S-box-containing protein
LIDRAPDIIFRVRLAPRPRLEYINRAVLAISGYSPEEWYADNGLASRIVHPGDRRKLRALAASRGLSPQPAVLRWTRKDGTIVRTEISAIPIHNRQGTLVAVEGVARDTTAGRHEDTSRAGDRFLRAAFEQAPAGLARIGADGRFLQVNLRICELTGLTAAELLGMRLHDVAHPDDIDRDVALLRHLRLTDGANGAVEHRCLHKDGSPVWVKVMACRLRHTGSPTDILVVIDRVPPPPGQDEEERRLTYAGIDVDTDRLNVSWNGRPVALTLKEVLLLRYMIRHGGEMLARDRLLRDVWGYEPSGRSRTLDVHVCRLRRKLPPLTDTLVTIGHFGYTLAQPPSAPPRG